MRRKCASIGQAIIVACLPRSYIYHPLPALAVFIHKKYVSRELVDTRSSLVLAESYIEVVKLVNVQLKDNTFPQPDSVEGLV